MCIRFANMDLKPFLACKLMILMPHISKIDHLGKNEQCLGVQEELLLPSRKAGLWGGADYARHTTASPSD